MSRSISPASAFKFSNRVRAAGPVLAGLALSAILASGCGKAEIAKAQEEARQAQAEAERVTAELASAKSELESELSESRSRLERATATVSELRSQVETANSDAATAIAARDALERDHAKALESAELECRKLESHRDELVEWVNDDLLPIAEQHDERLANLRAITDDIAKQVEEYRGLKFKRPFMRRLIDRDDVDKFLRRDLERELPKEDAKTMVRVMSEFGMIKKGTDLYDMFSDFMSGAAAAFYKPDTGTFYLIEGKNDQGDRPIVFHELIHALEDQHFDLAGSQRGFEHDSDKSWGYKALVEGSAEHFTTLYTNDNPEDLAAMMKAQMTPELMQRQMKMMQTAPVFLVGGMALYPYKNGAAYLKGIGAVDGEQVNGQFEKPPASSEQILHPEKHGNDFPHAVSAPVLTGVVGDNWEVLDDDSMGELFAGLWLAALQYGHTGPAGLMSVMDMATQGIGFKPPIKAAVAGWDGDRYTAAIDRSTDRVMVVWTSVWDSEADAQEFAKTVGSLLHKKVLGERVKDAELPLRLVSKKDSSVTGVEADGRRVVVVLSAPDEAVDAAFTAGHAATATPDARDAND